MTGQDDQTDAIQLHFCQRCGISIPEADIETGRAKAAPGGYVCVGCIYQARDEDIAPRPAASRAPRPANSSAGAKAMATVAILYIVGVTTFLLARELNRKQQRIVLPPIATAQDITALSRKLDDVDKETRKALSQLQSNDNAQREDLSKLDLGIGRVQRRIDDLAARVKMQRKDLLDMIVEIGDRTIGIDRSTRDILRRITGLERGGGDEPGEPTPPVVKKDPTKETKDTPPVKVVDPARKKQIEKLVEKMLNRRTDKQERFNAAVQLGDMQDPSAVEALVTALKKDSYDLVRRAAAYSLGMLGKHAAKAVPDLIAQLDDKQPYVGYMCEVALRDITKAVLGAPVTFHFDPIMSLKERRAIQSKWEAWYGKNKANLTPK